MATKRVVIVDSMHIFFRSHYALQPIAGIASSTARLPSHATGFIQRSVKNAIFQNSKGLWTAGLFGFSRAMVRCIQDIQPDFVIVIGEGRSAYSSTNPSPFANFRSKLFPEYKSARQPIAPELSAAFPYVESITKSLGLPFVNVAGLEADDVIASIVYQLESVSGSLKQTGSVADLRTCKWHSSIQHFQHALGQLQEHDKSASLPQQQHINSLSSALKSLNPNPPSCSAFLNSNDLLEICIVSVDKDLMQLVSPTTSLLHPSAFSASKGVTSFQSSSASSISNHGLPSLLRAFDASVLTRVPEVESKFHCQPEQLAHVLALMGDSSDGIPGVSGIGSKWASKLIQESGSIDGVFSNLDKQSKTIRAKLESGRVDAFRSLVLASLIHHLPLELEPILKQSIISSACTSQPAATFSPKAFFESKRDDLSLLQELEFDSVLKLVENEPKI